MSTARNEGEVWTYGSEEALQGVRPTFNMGGVTEPSDDELAAMQAGQYVLHARAGKLTQVPVEKARLAHDPDGHTQRVQVCLHPDGTIYVSQGTQMSKSADGGRSWEAYDSPWPSGPNAPFAILSDGTFVGARADGPESPNLSVSTSGDEGRTWEKIGEIDNPVECPVRHVGSSLCRLPDDTLVVAVESRFPHRNDPEYVHRSTDGGRTWSGPTGYNTGPGFLGGNCYETSIGRMASGKLLACIRYHGAVVPQWPLFSRDGWAHYKAVFLADSNDEGRTWRNLRPMANVHGQCHGGALGLSDGSVVVTHDHRYSPGTPCGRARVSRDEGRTWEDEAYFLYYGRGQSGFSQSVELDDGTIVTVGATSEATDTIGRSRHWFGRSDLCAIRWKLTPPAETG